MIIAYYIAVNIVAFLMYGADKFFAKKDMWRISEKALLGIAAIGGAFGAFAGMEVFRHKTKHAKFKITVPVLMAAHAGILLYLLGE
ncbi:MAG: DUF1294 domain-containing protein [Oscillospiraceae bacterium]|nr:DUF1294 domain-containing protein [Oscillospiraceae bacterium]